jgi:hypothetical protein
VIINGDGRLRTRSHRHRYEEVNSGLAVVIIGMKKANSGLAVVIIDTELVALGFAVFYIDIQKVDFGLAGEDIGHEESTSV